MTPIEHLRQTTEDDVAEALKSAYVQLPIEDTAALLEAFNLIIDHKLGDTAGDKLMWPGLRRGQN